MITEQSPSTTQPSHPVLHSQYTPLITPLDGFEGSCFLFYKLVSLISRRCKHANIRTVSDKNYTESPKAQASGGPLESDPKNQYRHGACWWYPLVIPAQRQVRELASQQLAQSSQWAWGKVETDCVKGGRHSSQRWHPSYLWSMDTHPLIQTNTHPHRKWCLLKTWCSASWYVACTMFWAQCPELRGCICCSWTNGLDKKRNYMPPIPMDPHYRKPLHAWHHLVNSGVITSGQRTHLGGTWPYKAEKEAVPSKFGEILHFPTTVVTEGKGKETVPDNIRKKRFHPALLVLGLSPVLYFQIHEHHGPIQQCCGHNTFETTL